MSAAAVLEDFVKRFRPDAAEGLSVTYQLQLTGDGDEWFHLTIAERQCHLHPGPASSPDVSICLTAGDWTALIGGQLDPLTGFLTGRIGVVGDLSLAARLETLFGL